MISNLERKEQNREQYNKSVRDKRFARKKRAIEYKGGICEGCKLEVHPAAFDFHHVNKEEKDRDPGLMLTCSDEVLFAELDKCILLCANCHRIKHFNEGY